MQACWLRTFDGCVSPPCPAKLRHTGCQRCWWARPPLPHPVEPSGPWSGCQQTYWHHRCRNEPSRRALSPARLWHHCSPATDVKELLCSMNCFFLLLMCHILKCPTVSTKSLRVNLDSIYDNYPKYNTCEYSMLRIFVLQFLLLTTTLTTATVTTSASSSSFRSATTVIKLIIFVAYGTCWVCLCCHNPSNSDMLLLLLHHSFH